MRAAFLALLAALLVAAAAHAADRGGAVDCILAHEPSLEAGGGAAADFERLTTFERIRAQGGSRWPREAWAASFGDFNGEVKRAIEPIQLRMRAEETSRLRHALARFDAADLRAICETLRDPYFAGLRGKALAADRRLAEGIARYVSGVALTDEEKKRLVELVGAGERELAEYRDAHRERAEALTGAPAFRRYEALVAAERARTDERIRSATAGSMALSTVIGKWERFAARGPLVDR